MTTTNTFTAPSGATLEADTNYFVVMENSNTNDDPNALYQVGITTSDGEDSSWTFRLGASTTPAELEPQAGQPHQAT